jgi:hypothetical protein
MDHALPKRSLLGVGLIAAGALLLLSRMHVLHFDWHVLFWTALTMLGLYRLVTGFLQKGRGVFFGTVVTAVGAYELLKACDAAYIPPYLVMPGLLILAGVGLLLAFAAAPRRWHLLVPSVILIGIGTVALLAEEGYFSRWEVVDALRTWWPVGLILFGAAVLLNRRQERPWP